MINGVVGHIRWKRYPAAVVEGYRVKRSAAGEWSLVATVISANAYNLRQFPLTFVAPTEAGELRWPIVPPFACGAPPCPIAVALGPMEEDTLHEPLRPTR